MVLWACGGSLMQSTLYEADAIITFASAQA